MPGLPCDAGRAGPPPPRRRGKGDHPVGDKDDSRPVGKPGGDKRPVRTPDDKGANRRHRCAQAGRRNRLRLGRLAAPRPPTSASSCRELSRPWPHSSPDQLDSLTAQRRSDGPGQRATTRPGRGAPPGEEPPCNTCRTVRVEYEQGRTTLSRTPATAWRQRIARGRPGQDRRDRPSRAASRRHSANGRQSQGEGRRRDGRDLPPARLQLQTRAPAGRPLRTSTRETRCPQATKAIRPVNPGVWFATAVLDPAGLKNVSCTTAGPSRTVPPLGSPPPGNRPASSGKTGRTRSDGNRSGVGRGEGHRGSHADSRSGTRR